MSLCSKNKYPESNPFSFKQNNSTYTYNIINEGLYPPEDVICYTTAWSRNKIQYKISDNYLVQTSWGRGKSKHMVECEIEYESDGLIFRIRFREGSQEHIIEFKKSLTKVANNYLQKKHPNTCAKISGIHVFGLNVKDVVQEREKKRKFCSFKPFDKLGESMKTKRFHLFSVQLGIAFENEILKFYNPIDKPILQEIRFNVQNKKYLADYSDGNTKKKEKQQLDAFVKVIDKGPIS
ncbi:16371_t:CDS:2 [Racocetra fulgida]|uniref:16371_t:CDS:1 n=1 Tax=Racocetra fulgida TaxID=60492 RepID=A0A9N9CKU2_9GLOM|nr:16371_t:CDS:2 [Racocetra fulgida]